MTTPLPVADQLLGKPIDWASIHAVLAEVGGEVESATIDYAAYHDMKAIGLRLVADESGFVREVEAYADGVDGNRQYRGALPHGLRFSAMRSEVREVLGPGRELPRTLPAYKRDRTSGELYVACNVPIPATDAWDFERYHLECEYTEDERLCLVRLETLPRR